MSHKLFCKTFQNFHGDTWTILLKPKGEFMSIKVLLASPVQVQVESMMLPRRLLIMGYINRCWNDVIIIMYAI